MSILRLDDASLFAILTRNHGERTPTRDPGDANKSKQKIPSRCVAEDVSC